MQSKDVSKKSKRNRHGLSRDIPDGVQLTVRRNSRFGCVICRTAVTDYEHIDPPFADASVHDPDKICLLCPTHHRHVTSRRLPKEAVSRAYASIRASTAAEP